MEKIQEFLGNYRHMPITMLEANESPTVENGKLTHWVHIDAGGTIVGPPQPLRADYNGYDMEDLREYAIQRIDEIFPRLDDEEDEEDDEE